MEAVIQTRKVGKERNKDASILIDRHFSPATRAYGYRELHPEWSNIAHWQQEAEKFDSLYMDSIRRVDGLYLLDEVEIKSKRRSQSTNMATKINEQSIDAYYDIRQAVDQLRDNGKVVTTIPEVMEKLKEFKIKEGSEIHVIQNDASGMMIIASDQKRFAISQDAAARIQV